jgi:hypothetical protein
MKIVDGSMGMKVLEASFKLNQVLHLMLTFLKNDSDGNLMLGIE